MDEKVLSRIQQLYVDDKLGYGDFPGIDADGFNPPSITVPDGSTAESLGISNFSIITEETLNERFGEYV